MTFHAKGAKGFAKDLEGWMATAAMVCSPSYAGVTLKNLGLWWRVSRDPQAREILETLFDERYYLDSYSDVKQSGVHPYAHYLFRGFLEGRRPSERLDTAHYIATYPDVKRARVNPALHYALFGKNENRSAVPARTRVSPMLGHDPDGGVPISLINNAWLPGRPLVSVVIPCFNYGAFVEEALHSVLAQTFRNYEVILVEGGSTDGVTPRVVADIEARAYERVRVLYRSERHLVGDNRNYGIAHARGRYICCLDADDRLKPVYLEMAVFIAEAYGYDIVSSSLQCFGESDLKWMLEDASFPAISAYNQIATSALFRKGAWAQVGGYRDWGVGEEHIPEDWDFWVRLLAHGYRCKSIRDLLMDYRVHSAGLTATCETDLERQKDVIQRANSDLLKEPVVAPRTMAVKIGNRWANLFQHDVDSRPGILIALPFITVGGAEQLFHTVCGGLAAAGFRVVVITTATLPDTLKEVPGRYDDITPHVYHLPKLLDRDQWEEFVHYLLRRYDLESILLAGSEFLYHCLPDIRAEFPRVRIVDQQFNDTGHIQNNRKYAETIDQTVVPSRALGDVLANKFGEDPARIAVIPHGIDTRGPVWKREDASRAAGLPEQSRGKLLVSFFGRMSPEKSPEVFVEMAARLADRRDLYFIMTGEGPEWENVRRLVAQRGLKDEIFLPGFVDDARPLMELSDIVVLTSSVDGMPLVILEAQAAGKPVVASAVGSLGEMVMNGETGFLCAPGDIEAFSRAVRTLADSEALRQKIGERARRFVQDKYGAEAMIESYIRALRHSPDRRQAAV